MKIKHFDGKETDTNKLSDLSAEIMEKSNDLFEFCKKYKIPAIFRYIDKSGAQSKTSGFYNGETGMDYVDVLCSLNQFFEQNGDQVTIVNKVKLDE